MSASPQAVPCRCYPGRVSRSTRDRRYPSDMTDAEWALIEPLLPAPGWIAGQDGCPGSYCRRDIVDGIRYLVHNGCVWRALPADPPHWRTVWGYVHDWHESGAAARMHDQLRNQGRVPAGRRRQPTAAIIDSQSVKAADTSARTAAGTTPGRRPKVASATWLWT